MDTNPPCAVPVSEVAARLKVSNRTAYRMVETGTLRAFRTGPTGNLLRVLEADLEDYISTQLAATEAER